MRYLRPVIFFLVPIISLQIEVSQAQINTETGNYMLEACRLLAEYNAKPPQNSDEMFKVGLCMGKLHALAQVANLLTIDDLRSCHPVGVSGVQTAKVIVMFLEKHPSELHEGFEKLALEALAEAWPCSGDK
jgi:hypothetical protein